MRKPLAILFTALLLPFMLAAQTGNISILQKHDTTAYNVSQWTGNILGRISQLKRRISTSRTDQERLSNIFLLCDKYESLNNDTLLKYTSWAGRLASQTHNRRAGLQAEYYLSICTASKGRLRQAIALCDSSCRELAASGADKSLYADFNLRKASMTAKIGEYKEALRQTYPILKTAESDGDTIMLIKSENLIGWVNMRIGQFQPALNWFYRALKYADDPKYFPACRKTLANMTGAYIDRNQMDSAYYFINKALEADRADQSLTNLVDVLNVKGYLLVQDHKNQAAGPFFNAAFVIRKQLGDPSLIISEIVTLCQYYMVSGHPENGIALAKEGIVIANDNHLKVDLVSMYSSLADNYKAKKDYADYSNTLEKIIAIKDSIYRDDAASSLAEMQARYEVQKKENIIILQKLAISNRSKYLYAAIALSVLLLFVIFALYANYRKNRERQHQRETIAVMQAEENARKRIASDLHDNIGAYASAISANVDELYANKTADTKSLENLKGNVLEIMSSLRDTIWALSRESVALTRISDRMKIYVQKIQPAYKNVLIVVEEDITNDVVLSPVHALHLFRILQESLNNALKHSGCQHLLISFKSGKSHIITIEDDGYGFNPDDSTHAGNGLTNMRSRALEAGISMAFSTISPHGTRLTLTLA